MRDDLVDRVDDKRPLAESGSWWTRSAGGLWLPTRRNFLRASVAGAASLIGAWHAGAGPRLDAYEDACGPDPLAGWQYAGTVPFDEPGGPVPFGTLRGSGLDARLLTDLSTLGPDALITSNDRFFIRTSCPDLLPRGEPWIIRIDGLVRQSIDLPLPELARSIQPCGTHLMECAGNSQLGGFGLMSAAVWTGVPLKDVLARVEPLPSATRVAITGFDEHSERSYTSVAGASWIFTLDQLRSAGAFLATGLNGQPLPKDHGHPVRLMVPRWYGAACVKWVTTITFVDDEAESTSQMREYASRTFQKGQPIAARDFKPASMDLAAMPVRIERWTRDRREAFKVIGIVWGGEAATDSLRIRFNPNESFVPVHVCPAPRATNTWALWSHVWEPADRGRHRIALKPGDAAIPAERLDAYFYTREVVI